MLDWLFDTETDAQPAGQADEPPVSGAVGEGGEFVADYLAGYLAAPLFALLGLGAAIRHGDPLGVNDATFRVPLSEQWRPGDVLGLLSRHAIDLYGWSMANDVMLFTVCRDAARRVSTILRAYGVPMV